MDSPMTSARPRHVAPVLPRIAALYCRVSSKQQATDDKSSLDTQLAALRAKAAELGHAVDDAFIYQDAHTGEELIERPALSRLREDAKARRFGLVLAYNVYALAKNQAHMAILYDEWQTQGIALDFVTEQFEDTPIGRVILAVRTFAAEVEGERRKDRFQRARRSRAESGKPATAHRANYGYQWAEIRDATGKLSRERLEVHPVTGAIIQRIFALADAGGTLRGIAADLSRDGIPTPTGRHQAWDLTTVARFLRDPLYCGHPLTLRRKSVPVDKSVRHLYARRFREVPRPREEQIALPATYAPALVTPEVFERVAARLRQNQKLSPRNNQQPAATLARGLVRCGHCGYVVHVLNAQASGRNATRYICSTGIGRPAASARCAAHGIAIVAHKLDAAIWARVREVLTTPDLIQHEVDLMHETQAPGADLLATIDRQLAELDRRITNKRKLAELVDDDQERAELAAEVNELRRTRRTLEAERAGAEARASTWHAQLTGLEHALAWCANVAGNLDAFTQDERRELLLLGLRTEVTLYKHGHDPRAEVVVHLPLSGALTLPIGDADSVDRHKYLVTV
jgi:site-specific DNA recombinase